MFYAPCFAMLFKKMSIIHFIPRCFANFLAIIWRKNRSQPAYFFDISKNHPLFVNFSHSLNCGILSTLPVFFSLTLPPHQRIKVIETGELSFPQRKARHERLTFAIPAAAGRGSFYFMILK